MKLTSRPASTPLHPEAGRVEPKGTLPSPRALELLETCRVQQRKLPRAAALAWERALFAEALEGPEPLRRIRTFLGEGK